MAYHMRRQIRDGAATVLGALASTGDNIFVQRAEAIAANKFPAIAIGTANETTQVQTMAGPARIVQREVELVIEAVAVENDTYADTLDQLCMEVETALANAMALGCGAKWIDPPETNFETDGRGNLVVAVAVMTFRVTYFTAQNAPDVAL
jgi:hypothetical protein